MKKLFTFVLAFSALMGGVKAQDPSTWKNGQDVTDDLQWKATVADDEDIDNPVWQGFSYKDTKTEWEFRDGAGGERDTYHSWGVYNIATWNVYQEFEIPAGIYTLKMAGAYREGGHGVTFDKWLTGNPTNNAFLYVTVGEKTFETPIMYLFAGEQKEALYDKGDGQWYNDWKGTLKDGTIIYAPACHNGADEYLAKGNWNYNEVLFYVPEKTTIRVGIDKRVDQAQDQVWWNEWRMIYEQPYNENTAAALVLYDAFEKLQSSAEDFVASVAEKYPTLGGLMGDDLIEFDSEYNVSKTSPLADIQAAYDAMEAMDTKNRAAYANTQTMSFVIGVCEGILEVTDFSGKEDFETAITTAKAVLYDDTGAYEVADYLSAAEALNKARIDYLLTQEKGKDGSYDFMHAISNPWFVNQEYTPSYNGNVYVFPEPVESNWFGAGSPGDNTNLEVAYVTEDNTLEPISDKAGWTTDETAEERWVFTDKWSGWHGGQKSYILKMNGYAVYSSDWAADAATGAAGAIWMTQVLNNMPEGLYTIEGYVYAQAYDQYATDGNQYIFMNDADGNELVHVKNESPRNIWGGWGNRDWSKLKSDFFYCPGGKVTVGFSQNCMSADAGMALKYFGTELDYNALMNQKIAENEPAEGELWGGDLATYNEMVAKIEFPISDVDAYTAANALMEEAIAFKQTAAKAAASYNVPNKYSDLMGNYEDDESIQDILSVPWLTVMDLGEGENDSYKDIEPATDIYNAYESYIYKYVEAKGYDKENIKNVIAKHYADLKENYADVDKLVAYERELATPINEAIFEERGAATASEKNPMDITDLLVNPSLADGPRTGWTCDGEDCNPAVNTYGRQLAECWNQKPFVISQTLRSLPAGNYELRVRACYRDGGAVDAAMVERAKNGEGQNAFIFEETNGREESNPIVSTASGEWTTPTFTQWWNANGSQEAQAAGFMADWDGTICILPEEVSVLNEDDQLELVINMDLTKSGEQYPFDTKVGDFYYPSSMAGFKYRITQTPDAYQNSVSIYVEEGQDLTLGLKKVEAVGNDWLIYDDFELYYTGNEIPVGIDNINAQSGKKTIFNIAGQRLQTPQKGINIINGKKVYIK